MNTKVAPALRPRHMQTHTTKPRRSETTARRCVSENVDKHASRVYRVYWDSNQQLKSMRRRPSLHVNAHKTTSAGLATPDAQSQARNCRRRHKDGKLYLRKCRDRVAKHSSRNYSCQCVRNVNAGWRRILTTVTGETISPPLVSVSVEQLYMLSNFREGPLVYYGPCE